MKEIECCYVLIPSFDVHHTDLDRHGCVNRSGHFDDHIHILSDGTIMQRSSDDPECRTCEPDECECFTYEFITKEKTLNILKKNYGGSIPKEVLGMLEKI